MSDVDPGVVGSTQRELLMVAPGHALHDVEGPAIERHQRHERQDPRLLGRAG